MEYLKTIVGCLLNLCVLFYIVCGIGMLGFLSILLMVFCWTDTVYNAIEDYYKTVSDTLKGLL